MKFASFDGEGVLVAMYDDAIIVIPDGAIQLTDEQWLDLCENQHYRRLVNGVITEYSPPPPAPVVPQSVSPRQAKLALLSAGLLDQVEAAIESADRATQINWASASEFKRTDPVLLSIGTALNLTSEQIDDLFVTAAGIP